MIGPLLEPLPAGKKLSNRYFRLQWFEQRWAKLTSDLTKVSVYLLSSLLVFSKHTQQAVSSSFVGLLAKLLLLWRAVTVVTRVDTAYQCSACVFAH